MSKRRNTKDDDDSDSDQEMDQEMEDSVVSDLSLGTETTKKSQSTKRSGGSGKKKLKKVKVKKEPVAATPRHGWRDFLRSAPRTQFDDKVLPTYVRSYVDCELFPHIKFVKKDKFPPNFVIAAYSTMQWDDPNNHAQMLNRAVHWELVETMITNRLSENRARGVNVLKREAWNLKEMKKEDSHVPEIPSKEEASAIFEEALCLKDLEEINNWDKNKKFLLKWLVSVSIQISKHTSLDEKKKDFATATLSDVAFAVIGLHYHKDKWSDDAKPSKRKKGASSAKSGSRTKRGPATTTGSQGKASRVGGQAKEESSEEGRKLAKKWLMKMGEEMEDKNLLEATKMKEDLSIAERKGLDEEAIKNRIALLQRAKVHALSLVQKTLRTYSVVRIANLVKWCEKDNKIDEEVFGKGGWFGKL